MTSSNTSLFPENRDWRFLVTVTLIFSALLGLSVISHGSSPVLRKKLAEFPQGLADWQGVDVPLEDGVEEVLGATDLIQRIYTSPQNRWSVGLFVAYFSSQRRGGAIHSPKNCLPGAGWTIAKGGTFPLVVPGYAKPPEVNHYIIQKGSDKQVVLYWYQSQGRIIASEYSANIYLVWDAMTRNRTDGALVRVVSPVLQGDEAAALEKARSFVKEVFPHLSEYIPG